MSEKYLNYSDTLSFSQGENIPYDVAVGIVKSAMSQERLIQSSTSIHSTRSLTKEGEGIIKSKASLEYSLLKFVMDNNNSIDKNADYPVEITNAIKFGLPICLKNKWLKIENKTQIICQISSLPEDTVYLNLKRLNDLTDKEFNDLKKRKLVSVSNKTIIHYNINSNHSKSNQTATSADLNNDMIKFAITKATEEEIPLEEAFEKYINLKPYNVSSSLGKRPFGRLGHLHPLLKVKSEIRQILLLMGFSEMPTNNYVENSFWNFDSLFQPQQHPARDAHDTFFLTEPKFSNRLPQDGYVERVRSMHENGDEESVGWRYVFSQEETCKNILRTHTTAVSSKMLRKLGESIEAGGVFKPVKYFSIDRVFRNETLDATHLAEFHQVEGLVADYNLTLGNLIGVLKAFFARMGLTDLRFKPAYNPYTEPSMEVFGYHPLLKKWVEIGNSGIFRPEMLRPMNLPDGVSVIAWGLSVERPTMIQYGISNIRELFGHKLDVEQLKYNPICWL